MRERSVSERVADRQFLDELVAAVPELRAGYHDHLSENRDEAFAHLFFMTDVWPWFIAQYNARTTEAQEAYSRLFCALEREFAKGIDKTQNVISVSFLEDMMTEPDFDEMRQKLPPLLRHDLDEMVRIGEEQWRARQRQG